MNEDEKMTGGELRSVAEQLIRTYSSISENKPELRESTQELMDAELNVVLVVINQRGKAIAKKYRKTFRPLDLRGIKADQDAVLGRGGLQ